MHEEPVRLSSRTPQIPIKILSTVLYYISKKLKQATSFWYFFKDNYLDFKTNQTKLINNALPKLSFKLLPEKVGKA